jgi:hypothetical protein
MSNNNKNVESLDVSEPKSTSSSSSTPAQKEDAVTESNDTIPCAIVSSDYEAVYRRRCAGILARAQPATAPLGSADKWVPKTPMIEFTVPPAGDPNAPGSRLRQIKMLEDAEANEIVEFTNYPYIHELLAIVAGTGDLPEGYDPWLTLFTAIYLALPNSIIDRLCEDLLWAIGGDREVFYQIFDTDVYWRSNATYYYANIGLLDDPISTDMPNREYMVVAHGALCEYLKRRAPEIRSIFYNSFKFSSYWLGVRFIEPKDVSGQKWRKRSQSDSETESESENDGRFRILTSKFDNGNPRMLDYMLTSKNVSVEIDTWPIYNFGSAEDAVAFAEILCAYITSKSAWSAEMVVSATTTLLNVPSITPEFANILLSNLVVGTVNFTFDATRLLTASVSVRNSEKSYIAWHRFVKYAKVFDDIKIPQDPYQRDTNTVALQCALLEHNLLSHVTDGELQEFMLRNLQRPILHGGKILSVSEIILKLFIMGRIREIRHLHRIGLDISYLRNHAAHHYHGYCVPISVLEFAEEQGWFKDGDAVYRKNYMKGLIACGSHRATLWMGCKYPDTCDELWRVFCSGEYLYREAYLQMYSSIPGVKTRSRYREQKKDFRKTIHWLLQQNRLHWRREIPQSLIDRVIKSGDYVTLRALYTVGGQKLQPTHINVVLSLEGRKHNNGFEYTSDVLLPERRRMMFGMLRCMWDVLRASKVRLNPVSLLVKGRPESVNLEMITWMMHRGFFFITKQ